MFERLKHHFNKGRCMSHLYCTNSRISCRVCDSIVGIGADDDFHVFHDYTDYRDQVLDFWNKAQSKLDCEDHMWREVKQEIAEMRLPEDPTYIPCQVDEYEPIPFTDGFDCEAAAMGEFYVGDN